MHLKYFIFQNKYDVIMKFIAQIDATTDAISFIINSLKLKFDANE
jgi:hypothetical protein